MRPWRPKIGFVIGSTLLFLGVIFSFWPDAFNVGEAGQLFLVGVGLSVLSSWARKRVT